MNPSPQGAFRTSEIQRRPDASPVLNTENAARYLNHSYKTLEAWRYTGRGGPAYLKVGRKVLYRISDLDAWLDKHVRTSTSEAA